MALPERARPAGTTFTWLQWLASVLAVWRVLCTLRVKPLCWPLAHVSTLLYGLLFVRSKLNGAAALRLDNWPPWVAVNAYSLLPFASQGWGLTAAVYAVFLGMAGAGWQALAALLPEPAAGHSV